jgi:predicted MPP superfamily phosphohydrolase
MSSASGVPKRVTRRRFLIGGAFAGAVGIGPYARYVEPNWVRVARLDIRLPGWPRAADGYRIGQISDLHCDSPADQRRTAHAARLLMAEDPDVVFVTGDYLSLHPVTPKIKGCIEGLLPVLAARDGAFALLGNHDWWSGGAEEIARRLHRAGFRMLRNDAAPLPRAQGVFVVGLDDCFVGRQDVGHALRKVPANALKLLLVHEPDYADQSPPGFALQFSGHSHGGQVRIPGLPPLNLPYLGRHYYEGLQQSPHHPVYTTRGVGMVYPKVRLFCPPEVALIRIFAA